MMRGEYTYHTNICIVSHEMNEIRPRTSLSLRAAPAPTYACVIDPKSSKHGRSQIMTKAARRCAAGDRKLPLPRPQEPHACTSTAYHGSIPCATNRLYVSCFPYDVKVMRRSDYWKLVSSPQHIVRTLP